MALSSTTFANLSTKQFSHHCTWALFNQFLRTKYILLLQKLKSMQYVNDSADPIPEFVPSERKPGNAHVIEIYSQTSVQSPPRRQRKVALWEGGVQWNTIPICCFPRGGTDQPRSQDLYPQARVRVLGTRLGTDIKFSWLFQQNKGVQCINFSSIVD